MNIYPKEYLNSVADVNNTRLFMNENNLKRTNTLDVDNTLIDS